jgi:GTPase Era involved in 16S rRNA processing
MTANPSYNSSLPEHRRIIFMLSEWVRQLGRAADTLSLANISLSAKELLYKVEGSAFSIAIVGEFKRGKSTLINALLGQAILPTDILPTTATLNRIKYGIRPQVQIHFVDGRIETIEQNKMAQYVTKLTPESTRIAATIKEAIVYYPVSYCRDDVDIIDTPGLQDEAAMTAVTLAILPKVDAAIFVTMALVPFSKSEQAFLSEQLLKQNLGRILFVVTGIDRCHDTESVDKIIQRVRQRIQNTILAETEANFGKDSSQYRQQLHQLDSLKVIGISAYQALQAKADDNAALLSQSRFADLEAALEALLEERGRLFLQASVDRTLSMSKILLNAIVVRKAALNQQHAQLQSNYKKVVSMIANDGPDQQEELVQNQKIIDATQQQVLSLIDCLEDVLKQAITDIVGKVSDALIRGERPKVVERLQRLDDRIANALENHSRRWAGKLQVELRRKTVNILELLRPEPELISQWMNAVGLYSVDVGGKLKQQVQQVCLASQAYESLSHDVQVGEAPSEQATISTFKQHYMTHLKTIITQQLKNSTASRQQLRTQLVTLLDSANLAGLQPETKQTWLMEKRLSLIRDETRIDLALKDLQALKEEIETIEDDTNTLQKQLRD